MTAFNYLLFIISSRNTIVSGKSIDFDYGYVMVPYGVLILADGHSIVPYDVLFGTNGHAMVHYKGLYGDWELSPQA